MTPTAAIHALALAACFAAHSAFAGEFDGVRRALQTMEITQTQAASIAPTKIALKSGVTGPIS